MKKVIISLVFLLGVAAGRTSGDLSIYGCTTRGWTHPGTNIQIRHDICIVYDPNMDKHFIVSTVTSGASGDGASTAIAEER